MIPLGDLTYGSVIPLGNLIATVETTVRAEHKPKAKAKRQLSNSISDTRPMSLFDSDRLNSERVQQKLQIVRRMFAEVKEASTIDVDQECRNLDSYDKEEEDLSLMVSDPYQAELDPSEYEDLCQQMEVYDKEETFLRAMEKQGEDRVSILHENSIGQVASVTFRSAQGITRPGRIAIDSQSSNVNVIPRKLVQVMNMVTTPCNVTVQVGGQSSQTECYTEKVEMTIITPASTSFESRCINMHFVVSPHLGDDELTPIVSGQDAARLGVQLFLPWLPANGVAPQRQEGRSDRESPSRDVPFTFPMESRGALRGSESVFRDRLSHQLSQVTKHTMFESSQPHTSRVLSFKKDTMTNKVKNDLLRAIMPSDEGSIYNTGIEPTKSNDFGLTDMLIDRGNPIFQQRYLEIFQQIVQPVIDINQKISPNDPCTFPTKVTLRMPPGKICYRRPFPLNPESQAALTAQINIWEKTGVVERIQSSPHNSPVFVVKQFDKKGQPKKPRIVVDYREINNSLLEPITAHTPGVADILTRVQKGILFSSMDIESAFTKIIISEEDVLKSAFTDPLTGYRYAFKRAPFGFKHLPDVFQTIVQQILADYAEFVCNYLDDLILYTGGEKESDQLPTEDLVRKHCEQLAKVIQALTNFNLRISVEKCRFLATRLSVLGHVVSKGARSVDSLKIDEIEAALEKTPKKLKQLQSLLGSTNFLRDYVPNYAFLMDRVESCRTDADIAQAFTDKGCHKVLQTLVAVLRLSPPLELPKQGYPLFVGCDASQYAIGAVLYQEIPDKDGVVRRHYVEFLSKRLSDAQQRYSATKRELLAIVYPLMKWRFYLQGQKFTVRSDHRAFSFFRTQPVLNDMLIGWADIMLGYDFNVEYVPGKTNVVPDALSRLDFLFPERPPSDGVSSGHPNILRRLSADLSCSEDEMKAYAKIVIEKDKVDPEKEHEALSRAHELGHFGAQKMVQAILNEGHWFPHMRSKAEDHVAKCTECLKYNIHHRGYQPLTRLKGAYPFEVCSMDIIDLQSLKADDGYQYILLYIDACTRFVILEPLKTQKSEEVAITLWKIISRFGPPKRLVSDNGSHFVNQILAELTNVLGINHNLVSPYHAASNGLAEAHVKTVSLAFKKMLAGDYKIWSNRLPMIEFSLNFNVSAVHNSVPASLVFNRPMVPWKDYRSISKDLEPMSIADLNDCKDHMNNVVYPMIEEKIDNVLNGRIIPRKVPQKGADTLSIGDFVYWRNVRKQKKTDPDWIGPYTVEYVNSRGGAFLLDALGKKASSYPEHPCNLKKVKNPEQASEERIEITNVLDEKEEEKSTFYLATLKRNDSIWLQPYQFDNPQLITEYRHSRQIMAAMDKGQTPTIRLSKPKLRRHEERVAYWKELSSSSSPILLNSVSLSPTSGGSSSSLSSATSTSSKATSSSVSAPQPKPTMVMEDIPVGTCQSCGAKEVELYRREGVSVCGKKTCYNDPTQVLQGSRMRKRKNYDS